MKKGGGELLSLAQAAEISGVSTATLRRAAIAGRLIAAKLGSQWVVTRENLNKWMQSPAHNPNKGPKRKSQ
jgi:excisionase family DNA binding protein